MDEQIQQRSQAWQKGFSAPASGAHESANPFSPDTEGEFEWDAGWNAWHD